MKFAKCLRAPILKNICKRLTASRLVFLLDIRLFVMSFVETLLYRNNFVHCIDFDPFLGELLMEKYTNDSKKKNILIGN